ncbi:MAG: DUF4340 domain-containing protein [Oscillospiraceae bacterium]|nr:DUF4340 domain-containing protein [Oscillospiraceae bacterium]
MKKRWRVLCAALCLALLCACGQKQPEPTPPEQEPEPEPPHVVSLVCSNGELTLRFHRGEDNAWLWTDNVAFPLDGSCVDALTDLALALDDLAPIPDPSGPENYGLYDARKYVTVSYSDDTSVTWRFGTQAEDGMYFSSTDAAPERVCMAPGTLLDRMDQGIYSMAVLPALPALTAEQLREMTVTRGGHTDRLVLTGGRWLQAGADVTDDPSVQQLASFLMAPELTRCVDFAPSEGAAALCGLEPPAVVLTVTGDDPENSYTLTVGSLTEDASSCRVTVNDDTTIYLMDAAALDVLRSRIG